MAKQMNSNDKYTLAIFLAGLSVNDDITCFFKDNNITMKIVTDSFKISLDNLEELNKDEFKELFNEMINWKEESQKLQTTANNCKRLKDNWNKLKECLKDVMNSCDADDKDFVETILDIMQELQGSDSNE